MRETVIVEAVRTPVGKRNGGLSDMHAADLSAIVLNALMERAGVDPGIVDDVVWGCVSQVGDQSSNIAVIRCSPRAGPRASLAQRSTARAGRASRRWTSPCRP